VPLALFPNACERKPLHRLDISVIKSLRVLLPDYTLQSDQIGRPAPPGLSFSADIPLPFIFSD